MSKKVEPRWRSGRSPSTPVRWRRSYPTFLHCATLFAHSPPHPRTITPFRGRSASISGRLRPAVARASARPRPHGVIHPRLLGRVLHDAAAATTTAPARGRASEMSMSRPGRAGASRGGGRPPPRTRRRPSRRARWQALGTAVRPAGARGRPRRARRDRCQAMGTAARLVNASSSLAIGALAAGPVQTAGGAVGVAVPGQTNRSGLRVSDQSGWATSRAARPE